MNCLSPIHIRNEKPWKHHGFLYLTVPCGKCEACQKRKQQEWFVRLKYEQKFSDFAVFVTLTYNDENLPSDLNVKKCDVQLYHKRLRQLLPKEFSHFRYYLTSEYGPETQRPHYHGIYFGIPPNYYSLIEKAWSKGFVKYDEINDNRIRYVVGYITEKLFVPPGREKLFNLISKNLGSCYIDKVGRQFNTEIDRMYVPLYDKKYVLPRYYKDKLFSDTRKEEFEKRCLERAQELEDKRIEKLGRESYYSTIAAERDLFAAKVREQHKKKKQI